MVIALGLILGFYYTRRLRNLKKYKSQKSSSSARRALPRKKDNRSKPRDYTYSREISIPILRTKFVHKKKKASQQKNPNRTASLLLHPHSLEQAKLQYLAYASSFQGLYEPLYQASQGKIQGSAQTELLKAWEFKIKEAHSQHLELVWRSSVRSPVPAKTFGCDNIFQVWLKYLKGWGLQRSVESERICWILNENIIEQSSQESEKSI